MRATTNRLRESRNSRRGLRQPRAYTNVFAPDFGASVFNIPLAERRRRLLAVDWVNTASVSRVWPSRIVVTVTERTPVAFAKLPDRGTARYRFSLIDGDGVLLSLPPRVRFRLPVLSGVTEEQTEADRGVRVKAMQHLLDDLGPQAKDISEINAASTLDMRVITEIDGHAVELWIGDQHYRSRYLHFLEPLRGDPQALRAGERFRSAAGRQDPGKMNRQAK